MKFKDLTFLVLILLMTSGIQAASTPQISILNSELIKLAGDFTVVQSHLPPRETHYEKILRHKMMGVFGRWHRLIREMDQLSPADRDTLLTRFALLRNNIEQLEEQAYPGVSEMRSRRSFNGRIEGKVVGQGDVRIYARIVVYNSCGTISDHVYPDNEGNYEVENLPTGDYYIMADSYDYVSELYDNITCFQGDCDPYRGTPVSVVDGSTTSGIDFTLRRAGSISGNVKGGGLPIEYFYVRVVNQQGEGIAYGESIDELGNYRADGLDTGTYFVVTHQYDGFINEIYDNIPCEEFYSCDATTGIPISVTLGQDTGGINFDLHPLASIMGTVTDDATGQPLAGVWVQAYDENGWWEASTRTNKKGKYLLTGLYHGRYYLVTYNDQGYQDELYDDIPCAGGCEVLDGHAVIIDSGERKTKIRFQLSH